MVKILFLLLGQYPKLSVLHRESEILKSLFTTLLFCLVNGEVTSSRSLQEDLAINIWKMK